VKTETSCDVTVVTGNFTFFSTLEENPTACNRSNGIKTVGPRLTFAEFNEGVVCSSDLGPFRIDFMQEVHGTDKLYRTVGKKDSHTTLRKIPNGYAAVEA
jgi:hypothetical protein